MANIGTSDTIGIALVILVGVLLIGSVLYAVLRGN